MKKRVIIVGATSGIGYEVAKIYIERGYKVGIAGRRLDRLNEIKKIAPDRIEIERIDVTQKESPEKLLSLIDKLGGMDLFILCSGVGERNFNLDLEIELRTLETNVCGFSRMVTTAYKLFESLSKGGHIAVISSIAGTKGIGSAASYSSSKRFQNIYIESLTQLSKANKKGITFTDIRPGFVATDLLGSDSNYPMLMRPEYTAKIIVKAIDRKKKIKIINWKFRLLVFGWKLIPQFIWVRLRVG